MYEKKRIIKGKRAPGKALFTFTQLYRKKS